MQLSWEAIAGGVVSITMFVIAVSRRVAIKRAERHAQGYGSRASF